MPAAIEVGARSDAKRARPTARSDQGDGLAPTTTAHRARTRRGDVLGIYKPPQAAWTVGKARTRR
jgi:hypothetical protein